MKNLMILTILILTGCVSKQVLLINDDSSVYNKDVNVEINEPSTSFESINDILKKVEFKKCQESLPFLKKVSLLNDSNTHMDVVNKLSSPDYEATDYRKEQTSVYRKMYKGNVWCHVVVITFNKVRRVREVSVYSGHDDLNKVEHKFKD